MGYFQRTKTQGIPYLSFNNLNLLLEKPLALVLLILLLLLFLGAVFYQFTFLLLGIFQIRQDHRFHFKGVTKASFKFLKSKVPVRGYSFSVILLSLSLLVT